jgi:hypothetical protein
MLSFNFIVSSCFNSKLSKTNGGGGGGGGIIDGDSNSVLLSVYK